MSNEIARRVQKNLVTTEPTFAQEAGTALAKTGGAGLALSLVAGLLPVLGVWAFIPVFSFIFLFLGLYLRYVK